MKLYAGTVYRISHQSRYDSYVRSALHESDFLISNEQSEHGLAMASFDAPCATSSPSGFIAISRNGQNVLVAGPRSLTVVDLCRNPGVRTLAEAPDLFSTSCAISADGRYAITTHRPAVVRFWSTEIGGFDSLALPSVSITNFSPRASFCWINNNGTKAIAVFTTYTESYVYSFTWDTTPKLTSVFDKTPCVYTDLSVSEDQGVAVFLELSTPITPHRLHVQQLCHVGTSLNKMNIPLPYTLPPQNVCIAESAPVIFIYSNGHIRVFDLHFRDLSLSVAKSKISCAGEMMRGVSEDGTRVLTCRGFIGFNVWNVMARRSIIRCTDASNRVMLPMLSISGDAVVCVDSKNNLWRVDIEERFSNNLRAVSRWPKIRLSCIKLPNNHARRMSQDETGNVNTADDKLLYRFEVSMVQGLSPPLRREVDSKRVEEINDKIQLIRRLLTRQDDKAGDSTEDARELVKRRWKTEEERELEILKQLEILEQSIAKLQAGSTADEQSEEEHEELVCAIDREPIQAGQKVLALPCGHVFHYDCTWTYFNSMAITKCPLCRKAFSKMYGLPHESWIWNDNSSDKKRISEMLSKASATGSSVNMALPTIRL